MPNVVKSTNNSKTSKIYIKTSKKEIKREKGNKKRNNNNFNLMGNQEQKSTKKIKIT